MNHKRRRPKHQRAGCLWCKPYKDERREKTAQPGDTRRLLVPVDPADPEWEPVESDEGIGCGMPGCCAPRTP